MIENIRSFFGHISILLLFILFLWNLYTVTFHGYVTNGIWQTYYDEEPDVFIIDLIELTLEGFLPAIICVSIYLALIFDKWFDLKSPTLSFPTNPDKKAKRLRRKKRKRKRVK
jgi:hypothetical protein